ncbi:N-acetylmuramoyl-L-alanine amidase CwlD [Pseudalkalibacillus hwajinpoensis]|uniref:N-acetylmuramoyl-L-alanine amidase CwlD n=1 Tax=Guptibacillus hwajinpoensis TaxID=208199 RepID=UPI001CD7A6E4|nr:N-acetylmuramoyl-L-alanine amidase CwlD [Pseudalkalibacillus hwajinpoensis]MCA0993588.1 N-acetylmuramoyl-L-alanine amidase CwlD [Pseudalkalibacillus hwajinpoensis]
MKKWYKRFGVATGIIVLLFIINYKFAIDSSWDAWHLPLSGQVIVIDPGHGGADGGAVGDNVVEKDIALKISLKLRDYLQEAGALVIMTRETDTDLASEGTKGLSNRKAEDLRNRVELINEGSHHFFVSIHLNAIPSSQWSGAQTFYNPVNKESEALSRFIQDEIKRNLENTNRLAKNMDSVYLLREAEIPGSLVEVGFLSNPSERELLNTDTYQNKVAASIYQGIIRYATNESVPEE